LQIWPVIGQNPSGALAQACALEQLSPTKKERDFLGSGFFEPLGADSVHERGGDLRQRVPARERVVLHGQAVGP
jgi:hypothetical protein